MGDEDFITSELFALWVGLGRDWVVSGVLDFDADDSVAVGGSQPVPSEGGPGQEDDNLLGEKVRRAAAMRIAATRFLAGLRGDPFDEDAAEKEIDLLSEAAEAAAKQLQKLSLPPAVMLERAPTAPQGGFET